MAQRFAGKSIADMDWSQTFDPDAIQQKLSPTGEFVPGSDLAAEFKKLRRDGPSRVDDGRKWRELVFDRPPKNAAEYEEQIDRWRKGGFNVAFIDADKGFTDSNIAVSRNKGFKLPEVQDPVATDSTPTPPPTSTPAPATGGGGVQSPSQGGNQEVTQGGPQTIGDITGDGNSVSQDQDNRSNQNIYNTIKDSYNRDYSDRSVRNFNYTPSSGGGRGLYEPSVDGLYDQPIGFATAGGYFDPNINSAAFVNKYNDINQDIQYGNEARYGLHRAATGADNYRQQAKGAQAFDPARMMQRIDNSVQESRDRAAVRFNDLYGNMEDFNMPPFQMADRPNPVENNSQELIQYYMDLLKA